MINFVIGWLIGLALGTVGIALIPNKIMPGLAWGWVFLGVAVAAGILWQ